MDGFIFSVMKITFNWQPVAALTFVAIIAIGALAGFIDSYYNEKVAQYVANDLRKKMYHHMQHLSLSYYDSHQTGKLISTITADVTTIQDFASSTLLNILVDCITIIGMVGIMFYLDSDFTLVALAVTPFLLFFVARFKKSMKKATREVRKDQSNMFVVLQKGLESIRSVNAFGRQDYEEDRLKKISMETVNAALKARRVKSILSPGGSHYCCCMHRLCFVAWRRPCDDRRDDHRYAYGISFLYEQVFQSCKGSCQNDQFDSTSGRGTGTNSIDPRNQFHYKGNSQCDKAGKIEWQNCI